jgi:hypothetical protein
MRAACLLLLSLALFAAEPPKIPEPYQSIVGLAHATPPEFAANALLRVVESGKIRDPDAVKFLTEEAFRLAAAALFRMPLRAISPNLGDTRAGNLDRAYRLKLDALTLQSRAVRDMLAVNKPKARQLFGEISAPVLPPLSCADALVPDVSAFYDTLAAVVMSTFSEKERAKEEHINFLLSYLAQVTSPAQLAPALRLIQSVELTPGQHDAVLGRINGILEGMQLEDRAFTATLSDVRSMITPETSASFVKYMQRGLSGTRCPDDSAKVETYWQSGDAKRIFEGAIKLRMRPSGTMLSAAERSKPEWNLQLTDFLKDLGNWSASQESSDAAYFHEKCAVYEALLDLTPPGAQRDKTIEGFVGFLAGSNLQQQSPVEWFSHAPLMLDRLKNAGDGEAGKLLDAYAASGSPALMLFVTLEKTFGSNLPSWVPAGVGSN